MNTIILDNLKITIYIGNKNLQKLLKCNQSADVRYTSICKYWLGYSTQYEPRYIYV